MNEKNDGSELQNQFYQLKCLSYKKAYQKLIKKFELINKLNKDLLIRVQSDTQRSFLNSQETNQSIS